MFGALSVDSFHRLLELFSILVHLHLELRPEIAIDLVPGLGLLGDSIFLPLGDVALDKAKPDLLVLFHDVR